ncbi:hypothetical protein, partial [Bacillus toyonensis]|uniref:hypothetical protein n=1 Tax=Bacillus toyonensis TaxID=155322 RepID=UPI00339B98AC
IKFLFWGTSKSNLEGHGVVPLFILCTSCVWVGKRKPRHSYIILYVSQKLRLFFTNFTQIIDILIYSDS